eukprot:Opistho-1_new@53204
MRLADGEAGPHRCRCGGRSGVPGNEAGGGALPCRTDRARSDRAEGCGAGESGNTLRGGCGDVRRVTHWISGIIAAYPALEQIVSLHALSTPAELHEGLGFLPLDKSNLEPLVGAIHADRPDDADDGEAFDYLTPELLAWCAAQSGSSPIAYIETQYFSGEGGQGAVLFMDGQIAWGPQNDRGGPINTVLASLGVVARGGRDAFDIVGLGRHRMNDGWRDYPRLGDKPDWVR